MNKAIFLDRDGVVNRERGEYTWRIEDFEIVEGLAEFLKIARKKGYLLIIISNQGGIQRGKYTIDDVYKAHAYLKEELAKDGAWLDDIYICPHHDKTERCFCRKPEPLMLEKAIARFDVDVTQSIFFGDSERDKIAGEKVGLKSIVIERNTSLMNYLSLL